MKVIRDLIGGAKPSAIEVPYNGTLAADSTDVRYKGSLAKIMDFDDIDHGVFHTFAGLATEMENFSGILEEEQGASGNYLPDDAAYGMQNRKITPCFPSTIIRGEYSQKDAAGTNNTDTGASGSAASTTFTPAAATTADFMNGAWIYMLDGSAAGELHYILNDDATDFTFATALVGAVASGDTFLVIEKAACRLLDFDATFTGLKSETDSGAKGNAVVGVMNFISAPGIPFQKLDRNKHDGLVIGNAKFFHDFTIPVKNVWSAGIASS